MESLISLVNKLQRACTALGDHGEENALPTLWDSLPAIAVVGGQVITSRISPPVATVFCFLFKILPLSLSLTSNQGVLLTGHRVSCSGGRSLLFKRGMLGLSGKI